MEVKTSELFGPALNWAVAHIEGKLAFGIEGVFDGVLFLWADAAHQSDFMVKYDGWLNGGPLYERLLLEGLLLEAVGEECRGKTDPFKASLNRWESVFGGNHPLEAVLRAFVASRLGDTVTLPVELVEALADAKERELRRRRPARQALA